MVVVKLKIRKLWRLYVVLLKVNLVATLKIKDLTIIVAEFKFKKLKLKFNLLFRW